MLGWERIQQCLGTNQIILGTNQVNREKKFTLMIKFLKEFRWVFYSTLLKELRNNLCILINGPFRLNVIKSDPKCLNVIPFSYGI